MPTRLLDAEWRQIQIRGGFRGYFLGKLDLEGGQSSPYGPQLLAVEGHLRAAARKSSLIFLRATY